MLKFNFTNVLLYSKFVLITLLTCLVGMSCSRKKDDTENNIKPIILNDTTLNFFDASNPNIQYTGRIDFTDPKAPQFWYPGVYIKAKFEGSSIALVMQNYSQDEGNINHYNIFIDNKFHSVLPGNNNQTTYTIANNLSDTYHTIEIFKRTEAVFGRATFYGFYVKKDKQLLPLENKPTRKIEFIGDSYTCGYGDEVSIPASENPTTGFHSINENNYKAWGAICARALNAQYHCTAYTARGMYQNNDGTKTGVLPEIYKRINPLDETSNWETNLYIPDVVVIDLGTNDFFVEKLTSPPQMVDSTLFVDAYINFIKTLRTYYPDAKIICVVPNSESDANPEGFKSLTRITEYIKNAKDFCSSGDENIFFIALPTQSAPYGEDGHPTAETQAFMAKKIEAFIKSKTGW